MKGLARPGARSSSRSVFLIVSQLGILALLLLWLLVVLNVGLFPRTAISPAPKAPAASFDANNSPNVAGNKDPLESPTAQYVASKAPQEEAPRVAQRPPFQLPQVNGKLPHAGDWGITLGEDRYFPKAPNRKPISPVMLALPPQAPPRGGSGGGGTVGAGGQSPIVLSSSKSNGQPVPKANAAIQKVGQIRAAEDLAWPPIRADGTIDPQDGTDTMPLTGIQVPRFWKPKPAQMSDIKSIGSYINGKETIFLMIASYRDFQCRETIAYAFERADDPSRLFVGAVDQVTDGDIGCMTLDVPCSQNPSQTLCKYKDQISVFKMDAQMATGPVTARHIGDRMYRGEYFVMQMDAHCHFARHWDTNIIKQWRQTGNEMAVLSSYLTDFQGSLDANFDSTRNTRPIMCNSDFEGVMPARYLRHGSQPEDFAVITDMPQLQPFWAAGFSFSRGHFKVLVPYDGYQPMVFQGEEIVIGIRGFTHGYDFYAPRDSVVFHEYADHSKRRSKIHMFWENSAKHQGAGKKSLARATSIIHMAPDIDPASWDHSEEERYGLGSVRSIDLFYKLFLIDVVNRKAVQLCPFVKSGRMHREFQKFLRKDGMGIDYSQLTSFDTDTALESVFSSQRPGGEKLLRDAIRQRDVNALVEAIKNAQRIRLQKSNAALYNEATQTLVSLGGKVP